MGVLYAEMCERVRAATLRLQGVAAQGNMAAMLVEARTLQAQCGALVELLEQVVRTKVRGSEDGKEGNNG